MCDAVVMPDNPLKVTLTANVLVTGSIITNAKPVPGDPVGGTSVDPARTASKYIGAAEAIGTIPTVKIAASAVVPSRFFIWVLAPLQ